MGNCIQNQKAVITPLTIYLHLVTTSIYWLETYLYVYRYEPMHVTRPDKLGQNDSQRNSLIVEDNDLLESLYSCDLTSIPTFTFERFGQSENLQTGTTVVENPMGESHGGIPSDLILFTHHSSRLGKVLNIVKRTGTQRDVV